MVMLSTKDKKVYVGNRCIFRCFDLYEIDIACKYIKFLVQTYNGNLKKTIKTFCEEFKLNPRIYDIAKNSIKTMLAMNYNLTGIEYGINDSMKTQVVVYLKEKTLPKISEDSSIARALAVMLASDRKSRTNDNKKTAPMMYEICITYNEFIRNSDAFKKLIKNTPIYKQAIEVFTSLSDNIEDDSKLNAKKLSNRILFLGMNPVKIDDDIWAKLEEAMSKNNYIRFKYLNYEREFVVQPWQLIYSEGMWSLYAYNQMPDIREVRFYNLPGIHNLEIDKKNTFELPEDFEYTKRAKGNFRRYIGPKMLSCKLKITSEKTLNYIKTYNWAEDQKFEKQDDGSTIMTFTTNQDYPVLGWVLSHGMYVQPLEPEWLVDEWEKNVREMRSLIH